MNQRATLHLLTCWLLLAGFTGAGLQAAPEVLWRYDFGSTKTGRELGGGTVVEDALATGGKALQVEFAKAGKLRPFASAKGVVLAGTGTIRIWVRAKGLNDVANGLRLSAMLTNETTQRRSLADGMVYGVRTREDAYRPVVLHFEVGDDPAPHTIYLHGEWQRQSGDERPTVWIGHTELTGNGAGAPYISGLLRSRVMVTPGDQVRIAVTAVNPTGSPFTGRLVADDTAGFDYRRRVDAAKVELAPGERRVYNMAWKARGPEVGHTVEFLLQADAGQTISQDQVAVGITPDGRLLSFPADDFTEGWRPNFGGYLYVAPATHTQSKNAIDRIVADRFGFNGRHEFFSWSWCDLGGFMPPEDPYLGNLSVWWLSLKEYKEQVAMMKATGVHTVSYILGQALGEGAYALYQEHPDYFVYDRDGELGSYDMEAHARYARRHEFEFAQIKHQCMWAVLDPTRPECRRWIADKIIEAGREMGFQGGRWDVWMMNVAPGQYRLDGTEIAPTWPEADRLSAESLKAVKDYVRKELPDYTWGYNYGAPEENDRTPLFFAEKCRDHGWILDEVAISYGRKTSPFHYWTAYSKRMVEWGDKVRQLDGIYDPWIFDRGYNSTNPNHIEVDWLHASIFRILAGGRVWIPLYRNHSALVGDLSGLAFRYSDIYSGWNLRLQPEDQTRIRVQAPDTLWWRGYVFTNKSAEDTDQLIVHLVNSPVATEVGEDRNSAVRPPVDNVTVRCAAERGKLPARAWLVMAEPMTRQDEPAVQAVPLELTRQGDDAVTVTVPSVLYLKSVVFEY